MKKTSIIIASFLLFAGITFAGQYQQSAKQPVKTTAAKKTTKKEVKKVPHRRVINKKNTTQKAAK